MVKISELKAGTAVEVHGWIDTVRDQKSIAFVVVRDRDARVQVTVLKNRSPEIAAKLEGLLRDSTVIVRGNVVDAPQVKLGGIEIIPTDIEITSRAAVSPIDKESSVDLLMDYRWLDLRADEKINIFRTQTLMLNNMRRWFVDNGYLEIMTPKIIESETEGGAEVFEVKYFDRKAYLTQSCQFFKQMAIAAGFERVFEIGAAYRAEKSYTSRHATEFFCLDVEIGFVRDEGDVMDAQEAMLRTVLAGVETVAMPKKAFPRITLLEAYDLLKKERKYEVPKAAKGDLDPEAEKMLCEIARDKWGSDFVFVTNFPSSARPFYIKRMDDNKFTRGYDLLFKGVEITSGGMREHDVAALRKNMVAKGVKPEDMTSYTQFFEYGCPPHGGYCIGLGRFFAKVMDLPNIKETTFLFRGPQRLAP